MNPIEITKKQAALVADRALLQPLPFSAKYEPVFCDHAHILYENGQEIGKLRPDESERIVRLLNAAAVVVLNKEDREARRAELMVEFEKALAEMPEKERTAEMWWDQSSEFNEGNTRALIEAPNEDAFLEALDKITEECDSYNPDWSNEASRTIAANLAAKLSWTSADLHLVRHRTREAVDEVLALFQREGFSDAAVVGEMQAGLAGINVLE